VALNQQTFSIVHVLPSEKTLLFTGMEVEEKPEVHTNNWRIGGSDSRDKGTV